MNHTETAKPAPTPSVDIVWSAGIVRVRDERIFGAGGQYECERFLERVFGLDEVRSVTVSWAKATATIRRVGDAAGLASFLNRVATALRSDIAGPAPKLPASIRCAHWTVHRHGPVLSTCEVVSDRPGVLRLRHGSHSRDRALARRAERLLETVPGVRRVTFVEQSQCVVIRYDPAAVSASRLIRLADDALDGAHGWRRLLPEVSKTPFGLVNANVGIAGLADFVVPPLIPVCAVLLIGTNLTTFRAARVQVVRRELGLSVLYTAIVAATLLSGQYFASALMTWFFRFWQDRLRLELASERLRLLDQSLPCPGVSRLITPLGVEAIVPTERLRAGDRVAIGAGETIPADGRVIDGEGIVDERNVLGSQGVSRKRLGDAVLAGSTVLAGSLRVEVARPGDMTRASSIVRALVSATSPAAGQSSLTTHGERLAARAVGPTLATAGVGLLVGDISAAAAILRPDYATGPGMAVPLETLRNVSLCARLGVVVRAPDVFDQIASVDTIVLSDAPALRQCVLEVAEIQTQLPEADLLRYAASAFRHWDDERAQALLSACLARGVHLLDLPPAGFTSGVTVVHRDHRVTVRDSESSGNGSDRLLVEIDGTVVGVVRFRRGDRLRAALVLERIREIAPVPVALVSNRPAEEVAALASRLGLDAHQGALSPGDTARILRRFRRRGRRIAFVGDCRYHAQAAAEADVAIEFAGEHEFGSIASVTLLQHRLDGLADLWEVAHSHQFEIRSAQRFMLIPNVLCVAGAFLFGFTGLTVVVLSNVGTLGLYGRATDALHKLQPAGGGRSSRGFRRRRAELARRPHS